MPTAPSSKLSPIDRLLATVDRYQQRHRLIRFAYAVIKKYGDDDSSYQSALITYYGFLSLFPLLIVATSVIHIVSRGNMHLQDKLFSGINNYFPAIGSDLQSSIHTSSKTGLALLIGSLITFYGAKGVADAVQYSLNHIWEVPRQKRPAFPKGILKSLALMLGGGFGFLSASLLSSYATTLGHSFFFKAVATMTSYVVLLWVVAAIYRLGSSAKHSWGEVMPGAATAAFGFQVLQSVGGYLVTHELRNLNGAYGRFGLVLAILFWIYLLAQLFLLAAQINVVHMLHLYPRSITGKPMTPADREAYRLYAQRETRHAPAEEVKVEYNT